VNLQRIVFVVCLLTIGLALLACGIGGSSATPDLDATVQAAIAQTRTAEAAAVTPIAATATSTAAAATNTPESSATDTPETAPSSTPLSPTLTSPPPAEPTPTPLPPEPTPTPTEEKIIIAESVVDGDDGNDFLRGSSPNNQGRVILLPGFDQSEVTEPMVFRDRIVFRVEVFDTRAGLYDGAGIQDVTFHIEVNDGSGQIVYERQERNPGYCAFGGGEPDCNVLWLGNGSRWPDPFGGEIDNGEYLASIDIVPVEGDATQWRWKFNIEIP